METRTATAATKSSGKRTYPAPILSAVQAAAAEEAAYMGGISRQDWTAADERTRQQEYRPRIAAALQAMTSGDERQQRRTIGEYITRAYSVQALFQLSEQATRESIQQGKTINQKGDVLERIGKATGIYYRANIVLDMGRKEQLLRAYERNGNDDGIDLFALVADTLRPFVYTFITYMRRDNIPAAAAILTDTPDGYPRPVYIPFYHVHIRNPYFKEDKQESKYNPRTVNFYSHIWKELENQHRSIFYTAGPSLDAPIEGTADADGDPATLADLIPDTGETRPTAPDAIEAQDTAEEVRQAYSIIGKSDAEIARLLSTCTMRDSYGHLIAADPATLQNLLNRARIILRSPSAELAKILHSLNLGARKETSKSGHQLLSILRASAADPVEKARIDAAISAHMDELRQTEKAADPDALKAALAYLRENPQAPTPAAIMARLTPGQKRQLSMARKQNQRSQTELFKSDQQQETLKKVFYQLVSKHENAHKAMIEYFTTTATSDAASRAREEGKKKNITIPHDPTGPAEFASPALMPLSTRQAQILRRMKKNAKLTRERLTAAGIVTSQDDPATIAAKIASTEAGRFGEIDEEIISCLVYFVIMSEYHLIVDARRDVLKWSPTTADIMKGVSRLLRA